MSQISIRRWLMLSGAISVAFLLLLGGVSLYNTKNLDTVVGDANQTGAIQRRQMDADMMHDTIRADVIAALLEAKKGNRDQATEVSKSLNEHITRLEKNIRDNSAARLPEAARKRIETVQPLLDRYARSARDIVAKAATNPGDADGQYAAFMQDYKALEKEMETLSDEIQKQAEVAETTSEATLTANIWEIAIVLLLALVVMTMLNLFITRRITVPLDALAHAAHAIESTGDLTIRAPAGHDDEIGQTVKAFNALMESLQGIVRNVRDSATKILANAGALASAAGQSAQAAESSSSAASSMAASVEQLSVSIDQMSEHAQGATQASLDSGSRAQEGEVVVGKAGQEMKDIADSVRTSSEAIQSLGASAEQISQIVNVIKEIADQTNLLALNAAIEAARAGEQGRGFAVVADEVRKLAERTANSTQEISTMITTIQSGTQNAVAAMNEGVHRVEIGVQLAAQAGDAIEKVAQSASAAAGSVAEMTENMKEQSAAGQEIARNVERVAQMSEQNHAAAMASADNARDLVQLAQNLDDIVKRFRT